MARLTAEGLDDLRRLEAELDGIPVESVVRFGDPVEEILLEAEAFDADLLALATSARGRLRRAFSRGVARRAAAQATVPTPVLHAETPPMSGGRRAGRAGLDRPRQPAERPAR